VSVVDIVLLWVDGNDPEWQTEYNKHASVKLENNIVRFRDWDILPYMFRSFERFMPWVRKIHFVTWGHLPSWLDINHPKLNIVKHEEYIDNTYLPVFSANPIEIVLHQIDDLSEKFIYFNDDTFIISKIEQERFFENGLPRDALVSNALSSSSGVGHFVLNDLEILNRHFDKRTAFKRHFGKWINLKYGTDNLRTLALLPWRRFTGFVDWHMPQPFLKSVFDEVWEKEAKVLQQTMQSRFRACENVNQYLFRYWQLASGQFVPVSMKDTSYITLSMDALQSGTVEQMITSGNYAMICLNDGETIQSDADFEEAKQLIQHAFEKILPKKSEFER